MNCAIWPIDTYGQLTPSGSYLGIQENPPENEFGDGSDLSMAKLWRLIQSSASYPQT